MLHSNTYIRELEITVERESEYLWKRESHSDRAGVKKPSASKKTAEKSASAASG
jgi:hypothetical protein